MPQMTISERCDPRAPAFSEKLYDAGSGKGRVGCANCVVLRKGTYLSVCLLGGMSSTCKALNSRSIHEHIQLIAAWRPQAVCLSGTPCRNRNVQGARRKSKNGNWYQQHTSVKCSRSLQVRNQVQFASPSEPFHFDGLTAPGQGCVDMKMCWRLSMRAEFFVRIVDGQAEMRRSCPVLGGIARALKICRNRRWIM